MAPLRADRVAKALVAKGMERDPRHHYMFTLAIGGVITLQTRISKGHREISDKNVGAMANQCALFRKEFSALVDCSLTETKWKSLVRQRCKDGYNPFSGRMQ